MRPLTEPAGYTDPTGQVGEHRCKAEHSRKRVAHRASESSPTGVYWTLPKTRSAPLSTRRRVRRNRPPHKAESAFGRYLLLPRPLTTSCRHSHFMLMFTNHENRPPFWRSALRTDRPFSSPGLLSNVWWADKPLSKVLRMRITLTVTLRGLKTLLVVTNPTPARRVDTLSPLVFGAFEGVHRHDTKHVRI